jgi:hypothetical protein
MRISKLDERRMRKPVQVRLFESSGVVMLDRW